MHPRELEAFHGTYEWIFSDDSTSFPRWARSSEKVFWINGKAGSGKSTLMRFLSEHDCTKRLLNAWAEDSEIIIASFFFWNASVTALPKSQLGLMQALLYQLVQSSTDASLDSVATHRSTVHDSDWSRPWKRAELATALRTLVNTLCGRKRLCLFVDGLDEYELDNPEEGNHDDLIDSLQGLAASPFVKLCVASRPWNVFAKAYSSLGPNQISMQDFTASDMAIFVSSRLADCAYVQRQLGGQDSTAELVEMIRETAQGVFLWVTLAVKHLRRGMSEEDELDTLKQRIRHLPKELDDFLERIFQSIERVHEVYAGRVLLFTLQDIFPTGHELLEYSFIEELVHLGDCASTEQTAPLSRAETISRIGRARMSINKWCKDLLEIAPEPENNEQGCRYGYDLSRIDVRFPHRTICDFVRSKRQSGVLQHMAGSEFNALLEKWRLMMLVLRKAPDDDSMLVTAEHALELLEEGFEAKGIDYVRLLHDLDHIISTRLGSRTDAHWSSGLRHRLEPVLPAMSAGYSVVSAALYCGLNSFAHHEVMNSSRTYSIPQTCHALALALIGRSPYVLSGDNPKCGIAACLLRNEEALHLNEVTLVWRGGQYSTWQLFLLTLASTARVQSKTEDEFHDLLDVVRNLLQRGADPLARIRRSDMIAETAKIIWSPTDDAQWCETVTVFACLHQFYANIDENAFLSLASRYFALLNVLQAASRATDRRAAGVSKFHDRRRNLRSFWRFRS